MSNVIELRLLDHCVHPMCDVMDVMTNLRQYYSNSYKITKREDISNPFEVLERQTLEVENIVEKNEYLTILFFSQLYTHLHTCQKSHPHIPGVIPLSLQSTLSFHNRDENTKMDSGQYKERPNQK